MYFIRILVWLLLKDYNSFSFNFGSFKCRLEDLRQYQALERWDKVAIRSVISNILKHHKLRICNPPQITLVMISSYQFSGVPEIFKPIRFGLDTYVHSWWLWIFFTLSITLWTTFWMAWKDLVYFWRGKSLFMNLWLLNNI